MVNYALGLAYLAWVGAVTVLGVFARRDARKRGEAASGPGGGDAEAGGPAGRPGSANRKTGWILGSCRVAAVVGAVLLALGLVATWMKHPPPGMEVLIWPGVVYPATALVVWLGHRGGGS